MKRSESIVNLTKAFIVIQKNLEGAKKDAINPHFRSKYATLGSCYEACTELLSANGVWVSQTPWRDEHNATILTTILSHVSGEYIESEMYVCDKDVTAQVRGSALSYARRYSLVTVVGIAPEDDDGNAATQAVTPVASTNKFNGKAATPPMQHNLKDPGDYIMDIGKTVAEGGVKGLTLREAHKQKPKDVEGAYNWAKGKNAKPFFQEAYLAFMDSITQTDVAPPQFEDVPFDLFDKP